jgi:hypothetical protein
MGGYVSWFFLFELEGESVGRAVEAEVVAACEHEDVFGEFFALGAGLRLFHFSESIIIW